MKKDIIINLIITIGVSISLFLVNRYFAIYLGIHNLGLMKLFTQMLAYLNLAEMGLASASTYALYRPIAQKNIQHVSIVLNTITLLYNKLFLFILIVGLILNPIIPFFVKDKAMDKMVYLYWSLYVISTALNYTFIKYSVLFIADQKYRFVRLVEGGSRIFCQLVQIFIIIKYKSFLAFIMILIIKSLIQYIFYILHYKKYYKYIIKTEKKDKTITKNLKDLFWHKIAGLIIHNTDLILISKFLSLKMVGIYASYLMIIQMVVTIINIKLNVLKPRVGKFIAEHNKEEIFSYFKKLNIIFLGISILFTFCTYKLIDSFIFLWLGKEFILPKLTIVLIIVNLFIESFRSIVDIFKDGFGFFDDIQLPIAESVINFLISILLIQTIGLNGVIIGTICSNIMIIFIAKPIVVFKRCFYRNINEYIKIYGNYTFLLFISLFGLNIITKPFIRGNINSWLDWMIYATTISIITGVVLFIVFLLNKEFRNIIKVYVLKKK